MVRTACGELCLKFGHQHREAIDGEVRELCEPAESSSLQGRGEYSAHERIVSGVQAHVRGVRISVLVWVGRPIVVVSVEALSLVWQWDTDHGIGERVSTYRIHCSNRANRLVGARLAIHLLSGVPVLSLLNRLQSSSRLPCFGSIPSTSVQNLISLGLTVDANCSRVRVELGELLRGYVFFLLVGRSRCSSTSSVRYSPSFAASVLGLLGNTE